MPTKKKKPWEETRNVDFKAYLTKKYPRRVPTKQKGYWEQPPVTSTRYWGTPEQQRLWDINPTKAGTLPEGLTALMSQYDPNVALGSWQNAGDPMIVRRLKARSQYRTYLAYLKAEREKGPAPAMHTEEWYQRETQDIKNILSEQGYAPEAAELTPERPPRMSWWQRGLSVLQAPVSGVVGFMTEAGGTWDKQIKAMQTIAGKYSPDIQKSISEELKRTGAKAGSAEWIRALKGKGISETDISAIQATARSFLTSGRGLGEQLSAGAGGAAKGFTGALKGRQEDIYTGARFLRSAGFAGEDWPSRIIRGTAGFGIDVLADPLTYVTIGGVTKIGKAAVGAEQLSLIGTLAKKATTTGTQKAISGFEKTLRAVKAGQKVLPESMVTKKVAKLRSVLPEEKLGGWAKRIDLPDIETMVRQNRLIPSKSGQALIGQRGLIGAGGHYLITGRPAYEVYKAGELLRGGISKWGLGRYFSDIGAASALKTTMPSVYGELKSLATVRRNIKGMETVIAPRLVKQLTKDLSEGGLKRVRDILEILPSNVLTDERLLARTTSLVGRGVEPQDVIRTLKKEFVQTPELQETLDFMGRRKISKGERGIISAISEPELKKAGEIADVLRTTRDIEVSLGLLRKEHPAYLPHIWRGDEVTGHPLYEYSDYLGFQERDRPFGTIRRYEGLYKTRGIQEAKERLGRELTEVEAAEAADKALRAMPLDRDLASILERRLRASAKAVTAADFQQGVLSIKDEMGDALVRETMDPQMALQKGYTRMSGIVGGPLADKWAPREVAQEMTRFSTAMASGQTKNIISRAYDRTLGAWKFMATSFRIGGFNLRNHYSNLWLRYLGGANPATLGHYTRKATVIQMAATSQADALAKEFGEDIALKGRQRFAEGIGKVKGMPSPTVALPTGEILDADEVMELAQYFGMHKVGLMGGYQAPSRGMGWHVHSDIPWEGQEGSKSIFRTAGKPFRETSEFVERTDRIALFIEGLEKHGNPEMAAQTVRRYLFDYDELSQFERTRMKKILPFYTWVRKSMPLVGEEFIRQPSKFTVMPKAFRAIREMTGVSPEDVTEAEKWMPDWYRDLGAEMIAGTPEKPLFINPNLPYQELGKYATMGDFPLAERVFGPAARQIPLPIPRVADIFGKQVGPSITEGLSPFLKFPIEGWFGKDMWLNRAIETTPGELWEAPGFATWPGVKQILKPLTGMKEGEERYGLPSYEYTPEEGKIGEKGKPAQYMRGRWVHLLNQLPGMSEVGRITGAFQAGEKEAGLSRLSSFALGIKPLTFDAEQQRVKSLRGEYSTTQTRYEEMLAKGFIGRPQPPEAPYPPDLYQQPEEIRWRQQQMSELGIPLAKQADIEGTIQNVLPNLSSDKENRMAQYRLLGFDNEFIDIVERLYKQIGAWKKTYKAPDIPDTFYYGYR